MLFVPTETTRGVAQTDRRGENRLVCARRLMILMFQHSAARHPHTNNETGMWPQHAALLFLTTRCLCEKQQSHDLASHCTMGGRGGGVGGPYPTPRKPNPCFLRPTALSHRHVVAALLRQQADTHASTQHTDTCFKPTYAGRQSCTHLFVYALAHAPPITLKCTHTCAATHMHNRHDRQ